MSDHYETKEINEETFEEFVVEKDFVSNGGYTYEELLEMLSDPDFKMSARVKIINTIAKEFEGRCEHLVQKITSLYFFSGIKYLGEFIENIVLEGNIDFLYKLELAKTLATDKERGFDLIVSLLEKTDSILNKTEAIRYLYRNSKYREVAYTHFLEIMKNPEYLCEDRYQNIFMIQTFPLKKEEKEKLLEETLFKWLDLYTIYTTFRILACQYLLVEMKVKDDKKARIFDILFTVAEDRELDINLRADAIDLILQTRDETTQVRALEILDQLGNIHGRVFSIYDNAQNVHNSAVEASAIKIINHIVEKEFVTKPFHMVYEEIMKMASESSEEVKEKTKASLLRVKLDVGLYAGRYKLKDILCLIYAYAENNEHSLEIKKRIIEELCDSANVCGTGNAFRILNAISGFGEVGIQISWEDQILSKFSMKFKNKLEQLSDEGEEGEFKGDVMMEWFISTNRYLERQNFEKFFRESYPSIREELWEEFKTDMEEPEFDIYTRKAVIKYLGY